MLEAPGGLIVETALHRRSSPGKKHTLPEDVSQDAHGPSRAWRLICDIAVDERVDALLIAGDAIDSEKSYAEGMAVFRNGLRRLQTAGVP
jgi:hypothetical protein